MLIPMVVILIWLGIYPQPVFNIFNQSSAMTMDNRLTPGTQAPSGVTQMMSLPRSPGAKPGDKF
jgi:hypothetical protein